MIGGIFNIGLAMIPNIFLKILKIIGIKPDKNLGIKCLNQCLELNSIRSSYAGLILSLEYIELNHNFQNASAIVKRMISLLP